MACQPESRSCMYVRLRLPRSAAGLRRTAFALARAAREGWSQRSDLNRGPPDYKSGALPLSYAGQAKIIFSNDWKKSGGIFQSLEKLASPVYGLATAGVFVPAITWNVSRIALKAGSYCSKAPLAPYT